MSMIDLEQRKGQMHTAMFPLLLDLPSTSTAIALSDHASPFRRLPCPSLSLKVQVRVEIAHAALEKDIAIPMVVRVRFEERSR